ncbi:aluminum-activated malate transporter 7-like [Nicotiana tabacum]|uniref:Aluminum-activated malate transporter 7-like n=1 Tax=Nicotiana tabacum TaxID=4097 RepID=A0AC58TTZ4_TOBAC
MVTPLQAPEEIKGMIKETTIKMSIESGKALKELAHSIKTMTSPLSANKHVSNAKTAAKNLKSLLILGFWEDINLLEVILVAVVASILTDIVICVEEIADSVNELASLSHFSSKETKVDSSKKFNIEATQSRKIHATNVVFDSQHNVS